MSPDRQLERGEAGSCGTATARGDIIGRVRANCARHGVEVCPAAVLVCRARLALPWRCTLPHKSRATQALKLTVNVAVNGSLVAHTAAFGIDFNAIGPAQSKLQAVLATLQVKLPFAFTCTFTFTGLSLSSIACSDLCIVVSNIPLGKHRPCLPSTTIFTLRVWSRSTRL